VELTGQRPPDADRAMVSIDSKLALLSEMSCVIVKGCQAQDFLAACVTKLP
jgi:hypothetical protein